MTISSMLLREEVVPLSSFVAHPSKHLKGVVRLVDKKSRSVGLFLDARAIEELLENIEALSPAFVSSLKRSRASGRTSSKTLERRLGL